MDSLITLTFTALLLFIIYFTSYILSLFSNCDGIPESEEITEKECCEGTWINFGSSVPLTLTIIAIGILIIFGVFWWLYSRFYDNTLVTNTSISPDLKFIDNPIYEKPVVSE